LNLLHFRPENGFLAPLDQTVMREWSLPPCDAPRYQLSENTNEKKLQKTSWELDQAPGL